MKEKQIVVDIDVEGTIHAETFGMTGTECIDALDKLLSEIALETSVSKKSDFFAEGTTVDNTIKNKRS